MVVIAGEAGRAAVHSGDCSGEALAFVSRRVQPLIEQVVQVMAVLLDQQARHLLGVEHPEPVAVEVDHRSGARTFRGVGGHCALDLGVVQQGYIDLHGAVRDCRAQLGQGLLPGLVWCALVTVEQREQLSVTGLGKELADLLGGARGGLAQSRVVAARAE